LPAIIWLKLVVPQISRQNLGRQFSGKYALCTRKRGGHPLKIDPATALLARRNISVIVEFCFAF